MKKETSSDNSLFDNQERVINAAERSVLISLLVCFSIGLIGVIGYPLTIAGIGITLMYLGILMACASFMAGFFTGILFGIPKRNNDGNKDYALNNSLVEIADWLTKIIVGLGLVSLKQIPGKLLILGTYVGQIANMINPRSASMFTICIVIYFTVLGIYIGYNYMRLVLSAKYKYADDNMVKAQLIEAQQQVEQKTQEVAEQKDKADKFKSASDQLSNMISASTISNENNTQDYIDKMTTIAKRKLDEGLIKNKGIDDPQKGMWGGQNEKNNRRLSATVKPKAVGLYQISIRLESTDPANNPLDDSDIVLFALHNTWNPPYRLLNIENGKAELELYSYGSFTVGALADKGNTELELDLAELPGMTKDFIEN